MIYAPLRMSLEQLKLERSTLRLYLAMREIDRLSALQRPGSGVEWGILMTSGSLPTYLARMAELEKNRKPPSVTIT